MKTFKLCVIAMAAAVLAAHGAAETFTYSDLCNRLTDLEALAVLPQPGEETLQWSSYDRASRIDPETGRYLDWSANGDNKGVIRNEDGRDVLAEMDGPGCIWRIWSAKPDDGHVRIYLDGNPTPVFDRPFKAYFRDQPPIYRDALVYTSALGRNCYVPIPYQKSCKIVADPGWGAYYHITYSRFPQGTQLPTFKQPMTAEDAAALDDLNDRLSHLDTYRTDQFPQADTVREGAWLWGGRTKQVFELEGPAAITQLRIRPHLPDSPQDRYALRELELIIYWDDDPEPAVWCPLGDFFGTAPGVNPYRTLPMGMELDGWFYSRWYMPFAKKARIEITNSGQRLRRVKCVVDTAALTRPIEQYGRFHAKWHRDAFLPEDPDRAIDWTLLKTTGKGRFVGTMLHVWNPEGGWWGEGDEKFFVDGKAFPSIFGTGSEDYFGYAWGSPTLFARPFHSQTLNMDNTGHVAVNRWHIADSVPFQKSFEGCIEKYQSNDRPTRYAAVAYWYLAPGGVDPYRPVDVSERIDYSDLTLMPKLTNEDPLEGERLKILDANTEGEVRAQDLTDFGSEWSEHAQLWWIGGQPGDKVSVALPVPATGRYDVLAVLTKAPDYAIVQLYLDGKKLGTPLDLYNSQVAVHGLVNLGTHDLTEGNHSLAFEIIGANPKAEKSYMVGLDYVRLKPAGKKRPPVRP